MRHTKAKRHSQILIFVLSLIILCTSSPILAEELIAEPIPQEMREYEVIPAPKEGVQLETSSERLEISFQAEIHIPKGDMPVFNIQSTPLDQNFVDKVIEELMKDAVFYPGEHIYLKDELKHIDDRLAQLKGNKDEISLQRIKILEDLKENGLPTFDPELIKSLKDNIGDSYPWENFFQLAGKRDDRYFFLGIDIQPECNYYQALFTNSKYENFSRYQVNAVPLIRNTNLSQDEVIKFSRLNPEGREIDYYGNRAQLIRTAEEFKEGLEELREWIKENDKDEFPDQVLEAPSFGMDEAEKMANDFLNKLGLNNLSPVLKEASTMLHTLPTYVDELSFEEFDKLFEKWVETNEPAPFKHEYEPVWHLRYQPSFQGIPFLYDRMGIHEQPYVYDRTNPNGRKPADWQFEHIDLYINDDGIVAFDYSSPMEVSKIISEKAELLPIEEINDLAKELLPSKFEGYLLGGNEEVENSGRTEVLIVKMALSYWRVLDDNDPESATVIPVWNFYPIISRTYEVEANPEYDIEASSRLSIMDHTGDPRSCLTLNAIDGTVIELASFDK